MATTAKPRSVLLVEDDPIYLELLQEAFADAGFRTLRADNGERALEVLRRESVDLVVSDFIMPEVNGLELCRLVSEDLQFDGVKMILYSCNTDSSFRRRAREMGAIDYLPKSEDAAGLVGQILRLAGFRAAVKEPSPRTLEEAAQLRLLFENLLDLIRIAAASEHASEPARVAWEAAQRNSSEIRRLLAVLESHGRVQPAPPLPAELQAVEAPASR